MNTIPTPWQIWIDTGGTFTDAIALTPTGEMRRAKVLSSGQLRGRLLRRIGPARYQWSGAWLSEGHLFAGYDCCLIGAQQGTATILSTDAQRGEVLLSTDLPLSQACDIDITAHEEAPILAARLLTGTPLHSPLPPMQMRLGSTKGTNALLEGQLAPVCLLVTKGFADLPLIGTQQRPELFALHIPPPLRLFAQVIEVDERLSAQGEVLTPLSAAAIADAVSQVQCPSVAVAFLHAYRNPVHELQMGAALRAAGLRHISLSSELSPTIKLLPRMQTTLVNACLSPVIKDYLGKIAAALGQHRTEGQLLVMSSAGGLLPAASYHPKDSLLSGPAGGIVGAAYAAQQLGFPRVLTLDMGGTSTDTARYDGRHDYRNVTQVGGVEMNSPALLIETVAAGGGSICHFDGQKLCVGPASAGAQPGPACYGAGGPLTITDVNLLLGRLDPSAMSIPVHLAPARAALAALQQRISDSSGMAYTEQELLDGFLHIADEKMAEAIRRTSVAQGFDPADYALLAFGGAGGLHACAVAECLGISTVLLPQDAGLLSAFGMGQARVERRRERQVLRLLEEVAADLPHIVAALASAAQQQLATEGFPPEQTEVLGCQIFLRLQGQDSTLRLDWAGAHGLGTAFEEEYIRLFGHFPTGRRIEVERIGAVAATRATPPVPQLAPTSQHPARFAQAAQGQVTCHWTEQAAGAVLPGPAVVLHPHATAFVAEGWQAEWQAGGHIIVRHMSGRHTASTPQKQAIALELFTNRFAAIAEEMGAQLQRTAFSVNIKERLDFSCALLDEDARLVANAPHIPVHLGSLGICARLTLAAAPLLPGDVLLVNHPKYGGSHLPDVTLLAGVFTEQGARIGYVINRAHHAEIGGKRPGSMPPDAANLAEEGVVFAPTYLVKGGVYQWELIEAMLREAPWPSRAVAENVADIKAALASLRMGETALQALVRGHGLAQVHHYMALLRQSATALVAEALQELEGQVLHAAEMMDDGHQICVRLDVTDGHLTLDFAGTSGVHPRNLNANIAIVYSVVLYVLRLLCGKPIPLNEGIMARVDIRLPAESFLHPIFADDPAQCPAVVGGNTEVSQRLADTLLKALRLAACSQGTMNNLLFGNAQFGYYETIGGGTGAGVGFAGRDAVHQHLTNTRITDPEDLELRYPVQLLRFGIRRGSGGRGQWAGGDGIIRELRFLETMDLTILSQHRSVAPYGVAGGQPGAVGKQTLIRENGQEEPLAGCDSRTVHAGDRVRVETPGGGGWGEASAAR